MNTFPLADNYHHIYKQYTGRVAESEPSLDPFSEKHLHCIWFDDRLRPEVLQTERGEEVRILYPGKWNQESGPDFLDAEWSIGGRRLRGDVEIHIRPMDWQHHGHQKDPRYGNVGLHVCYEHGELPSNLLPLCCEQVALRTLLDQRSHFFFDAIDLKAYPWQKEASRSGLREYFTGKSEEDCSRILEAAGQERLRRKSLRMARVLQSVGEEQALYTSLLRGLGYKNNAEISESLARSIPVALLSSLAGTHTDCIYALLLGVAGLLPNDIEEVPMPPWLDVRKSWDLWWPYQDRFSEKILKAEDWRMDHCRPGNHPFRRLRAAATWVAQPETLGETFKQHAGESDSEWVCRCLKVLRVPSPSPARDSAHLVGSVRAGTLFLNAIVPWRICTGKNPVSETLWCHLPDEAFNSKTKRVALALFGPDQHPRLYKGGLRKQGLLQFHEDFQL